MTELRIIDEVTGMTFSKYDVPYSAVLYKKDGESVKVGDLICEWDAYNATTLTEAEGTVRFEDMVEGLNFKTAVTDEGTLNKDKVIIDSKDRNKNPALLIVADDGTTIRQYNLPVNANVGLSEGQRVKVGAVLFKIPRAIGKATDITGGLPRVTELFEARTPSTPAVLSEINGSVVMGKLKRNNREIIVRNQNGIEKHYLVPLTKQILVQEDDYVRAGTRLSDGPISPNDILDILGPNKAEEYIVNQIQAVYRLQGVKINDKHFEIIVRQMLRKVKVTDPGDTEFLQEQLVDKWQFQDTNDAIYGRSYVLDPHDSRKYSVGDIISARELHNENELLSREGKNVMEVRPAKPATAKMVLQGITRAALRTDSFISAASFQETTKVLSEAAIRGRIDDLEGLKENVICGHPIPAGTGLKKYKDLFVVNKADYAEQMNEL